MAQGSDRGGQRGDRGNRGKEFGGGAPTPNRRDRRSGSARRAAPVKKPFPLGFAVGVTALVLALGGILVYAVMNTGAGFTTALDKADDDFTGLRVSENLSANHINPANGARVAYPDVASRPPVGGNHSGYWQNCGVYTEPVVNEHAVHSLEHGAVWITYQPELPADQVSQLESLVSGDAYGMISPYPGQSDPVVVSSWGRQISAQSATDPQVAQFVQTYSDGPQKREVGASCQGQIDQPGTVPFVVTPDGSGIVPGPTDGPTVPASGSTDGGTDPGTLPSAEPTTVPEPGQVTPSVPAPAPAG